MFSKDKNLKFQNKSKDPHQQLRKRQNKILRRKRMTLNSVNSLLHLHSGEKVPPEEKGKPKSKNKYKLSSLSKSL
jgi:hypothetical protein